MQATLGSAASTTVMNPGYTTLDVLYSDHHCQVIPKGSSGGDDDDNDDDDRQFWEIEFAGIGILVFVIDLLKLYTKIQTRFLCESLQHSMMPTWSCYVSKYYKTVLGPGSYAFLMCQSQTDFCI